MILIKNKREKFARNCGIVLEVIKGEKLCDVANRLNLDSRRIGQIICHTARELMPGEDRLNYLTAKQIAQEYSARLEQLALREMQGGG